MYPGLPTKRARNPPLSSSTADHDEVGSVLFPPGQEGNESTEKRIMAAMPTWHAPAATDGVLLTGLRVTNSLTRAKEELVPQEGRSLTWYVCGPTVYDHSHLGHARTYLAFDVLRRILTDYLHYDVTLCMNITDIDDKIIMRANERGMSTEELSRMCVSPLLLNVMDEADAECSFEADYLADMAALGVQRPDVLTRVSEYVPEVEAYIQQIIEHGFASGFALGPEEPRAANTACGVYLCNVGPFYACGCVVCPFALLQGALYARECGHRQLLTRPQYEAGGSVYFDTTAYQADESSHTYGKLAPESIGDVELIADGEGKLAGKAHAGDKKAVSDFALLKKSMEGEPVWPSRWGEGRPGWHIECSAMANAVLGAHPDMHSGGLDLKFPHQCAPVPLFSLRVLLLTLLSTICHHTATTRSRRPRHSVTRRSGSTTGCTRARSRSTA